MFYLTDKDETASRSCLVWHVCTGLPLHPYHTSSANLPVFPHCKQTQMYGEIQRSRLSRKDMWRIGAERLSLQQEAEHSAALQASVLADVHTTAGTLS